MKINSVKAQRLFVIFMLLTAASAQAAGAALRSTYARMSRAGGESESLGSGTLTQALDRNEGRDFFRDWQSTSTSASAAQIETETLAALAGGASARFGSDRCYTGAEISSLFQKVRSQHVVANQSQYDPAHLVGFCFGRALIVHTQSLLTKPGVPVLKMWSVGHLKRGATEWRYHVTSLVLGCDRQWYAMDTILGAPRTAKAWISAMKGSYNGRGNHFYLSRADRLSPDGGEYDDTHFNAKIYRSYFQDYLDGNPGLKNLR